MLHQRIVTGVPFRGLQSAKKVDCLSKVYSMGSPAPPTTSQTPLGIWSLGLLIQWGVIFFFVLPGSRSLSYNIETGVGNVCHVCHHEMKQEKGDITEWLLFRSVTAAD